MVKLTIHCLLQLGFFLKVVLSTSTSFGDQKRESKITGGNKTLIQEYPYNAFLLLNDGREYRRCGGSIISVKAILTSAYCLLGAEIAYVRIGSTFFDEGGTQYQSTTFLLHPMYRLGSTVDERFDVGIIRISQGISLDGINARAVDLTMLENDPQMGVHIIITGWGLTHENDTDYPRELRVAQTLVLDKETCKTMSGEDIQMTQFCAGETGVSDMDEDNPDVCQGDYGGPAVDMATGDQIGIASYGNGCGEMNKPSIYINLGSTLIYTFVMLSSGDFSGG